MLYRSAGPRVGAVATIEQLDRVCLRQICLPKSMIALLQRVQNAHARLIITLGSRDHVTSALRHLHWLPVYCHVLFKLCSMMYTI